MTQFPNWFADQQYNFEEQLAHLSGKPNLKFLQIGAYTGDASVWLCENVLTDPTSRLTDVDTWAGSDEDEHKNIDFEQVFTHYQSRVAPYKKVVALKMTSDKYFEWHLIPDRDFVYVDGNHTSAQVARDAENSWALLRPGGILAFDDYLWGQDLPPDTTPKPAIDNFLSTHTGEYTQLVDSYQVWIQKNDN